MHDVVFFERPDELRAWFAEHHATATELWVGYFRRSANRPGITWPESVDEALCYGWIDGIRKRIDDLSYTNRFTPRKARSTWSEVNVRRVESLTREGRMAPAGLAAFGARSAERTGVYSHEQRTVALGSPYEERLAANTAALGFWESQTATYRKAASWWVRSAKLDATRERRFDELVRRSAAGETLPQFTRRRPS